MVLQQIEHSHNKTERHEIQSAVKIAGITLPWGCIILIKSYLYVKNKFNLKTN